MAKIRTDTIDKCDLEEYIEMSDFHFELAVLNLLRSKGVSSSHGGLYTDPVSGKDREYDIRASIASGSFVLRLAVECKNLRDCYPLLIHRVPRIESESFHHVMMGRHGSIPQEGGDSYPLKEKFFATGEYVGKSATQVGRSVGGDRQLVASDSETYEKWSQAISSSYDLIAQTGHSYRGGMTVRASVVMPVLVVPDDMLWAVDYAADGTLVEGPQRVGEVNLYLGKSVRTKFLAYDLTHMPVMTFGKFSTYLDDLLSKGGSWSNLFPDESFLRMYERDGLSWRV